MSLINNMLAGLEDRQAYMSEGQDLVLDGLASVNDDSFHEGKQKVNGHLAIVLLIISALFLSGYIYKHYLHDKTVQYKVNTEKVAGNSQVTKPAGIDTAHDTTGQSTATSEPQPQPQRQSPHKNIISLKMDYSITGATSTTPAPAAAQDVKAVEEKQDAPKTTSVTGPSITSFEISSINGGNAVVRIKLNENAGYRVYELNKPYRIAVELEKYLSFPDSIPEQYGHGLISWIRGHHFHNNERTMVVLDLSEKGVVENSEIQETDGGYALVVDIAPVNKDTKKIVAGNNKDAISPETPVSSAGSTASRGTLSVTKKNSTPDQILARGLSDYQKGDIRGGLDQITNALEIAPTYVKARSTLVNLLIEQNDLLTAIRVLDKGIMLLPKQYNWRELKAKLLVKLNRYDSAIEVLSQAGPDVNVNPEYYAFLAALLQQQGRNKEAVVYYQKALAARGDNGIWWMGLGISLERTGKLVQAEKAYRKAVSDNSLTPDIRDYIKGRLSVLSGH